MFVLGSIRAIRETTQREPFFTLLRALLNGDLLKRVYISKGPPTVDDINPALPIAMRNIP